MSQITLAKLRAQLRAEEPRGSSATGGLYTKKIMKRVDRLRGEGYSFAQILAALKACGFETRAKSHHALREMYDRWKNGGWEPRG